MLKWKRNTWKQLLIEGYIDHICINYSCLCIIMIIIQMLARLVDDFLMVSYSPAAMHSVFLQMNRGIDDYQCFVNPNKTQANFINDDYQGRIMSCTTQQCMV